MASRAAKPICVTSSTKMPSSGSSARIASRMADLRHRAWPCACCKLRLPLFHLGLARLALGVVARQRVEQRAQHRRGVADQRDVRSVPARSGSSGSASTRITFRSLSTPQLSVAGRQAGADRRSPHRPRATVRGQRQRDAERIAAVEHAAAAPIAQHRRLQHGGQARALPSRHPARRRRRRSSDFWPRPAASAAAVDGVVVDRRLECRERCAVRDRLGRGPRRRSRIRARPARAGR